MNASGERLPPPRLLSPSPPPPIPAPLSRVPVSATSATLGGDVVSDEWDSPADVLDADAEKRELLSVDAVESPDRWRLLAVTGGGSGCT